MRGKHKILVIENSVAVTGALKSIVHSCYNLRTSYDFSFLIPRKSKGRQWIESVGFQSIYELPMIEISKKISSLLIYVPCLFINAIQLNRIIKKRAISLIHLNDLYNLLPVIIRLLGNNTPYVTHIRFLPNRFPKRLFNFWLRLHLRYAERVIAVSQSVLNQLPQHSKLTLVYDELPIEEKYPDLTVSDASKSVFIFLYLSNFIKGKGQDFALEAFGKVHYQLPDWKLRFVGGDMGLKKNLKYKESLKQRAIKLGIFEKTEWVSFTEDVELEYKHADIVLNFSESESFSITCLEALSFGRPVIATDCGGPREIIDHEETGLLVANRDINSMVNAMMKLALDRKSRLTMGIEAKKRMKIKFGSGKTIETIQTVFDTALKQK